MQAKSWQWNAPDQRRAGLERKARTIATDWLEPLIGFAKIPLAVVPGANTALGNTEKFLARYTGDLDISPLNAKSGLVASNSVAVVAPGTIKTTSVAPAESRTDTQSSCPCP